MEKAIYKEKINYTLSGKGFSEKSIQQVFINLLGDQTIFDPKKIKYQIVHNLEEKSKKEQPKKQEPKKQENNKKNKKPNRKALIIQNNQLRLEKEWIDQDLLRIEKLDPEETKPKLKTTYGKLAWLLKLLSINYTKCSDARKAGMLSEPVNNCPSQDLTINNWISLLDLYLELQPFLNGCSLLDKKAKLIKKVEKIITKIHYPLRFQLEYMGDRMPPLNKFPPKLELDKWQIEALTHIYQKQSVLICAPTSSGKTIISTFISILEGTKVFVVPSESLVWQVASVFSNLIGGYVALIGDNIEYIPDVDHIKLYIGTPDALESYLSFNSVKEINYAIFDEVHDLNSPQGAATERLMKWVQCPMLWLSATIGNAQQIQKWWNKPGAHREKNGELHLIQYQGRFINLQQWIFDKEENSGLRSIFPLSLLSFEQIKAPNFIESDMGWTSYDCYQLWEYLEKHFSGKLPDLDPEVFFAKIKQSSGRYRIFLTDVRSYEKELQRKLFQLTQKEPNKLKALLQEMNVHSHDQDETVSDSSDETNSLEQSDYNLIQQVHRRQMLPMLWFQLNTTKLQQTFSQLIKNIETEETLVYPNYREDLEKRWKQYHKQQENMESVHKRAYDSEKITKNDFWKVRQNYVLTSPPDIDGPHPKFVYSPQHKSVSPEIIKELVKTLGYELHLRQPNRHILIRGLKRGLALYCKYLPIAYLQAVQRLAQAGMIGTVFSDISLAYGVNMPFRTVVFGGDHPELDSLMAKQMSGRAGRRGMDKKGNVIYYNLSSEKLLQLACGQIPQIRGQITNYSLSGLQTYIGIQIRDKRCYKHNNLTKFEEYSRIFTNSLLNYVDQEVLTENSSRESESESESESPSSQHQKSINFLKDAKLLVNDGNSTNHSIFAPVIWALRKYQAESIVLMYITPMLLKVFHNRRNERDDINMFLIFSHIASRHQCETKNSATVLPELNTLYAPLEKAIQQSQLMITKNGETELQLPHWGKQLDGELYTIFQANQLKDCDVEHLDEIKQRLHYIAEVCRIYRNYLIDIPTYLPLEVTVRKMFRRLYYLLNYI